MNRPLDPRLLRAVPRLRGYLVLLSGLQFLGALLVVAQAALLADAVVAMFLRHERAADIARPLALLAAVGVARAALAAGQERAGWRASVRVRADLRSRVLAAVTRGGPLWVQRQPPGRLVTAAGPGLESLDGYLTRAVPALVAALVVPPVALVCIGLGDWQSAVILLVTLPLVPLFMVLVGVTTRRRMERQYATLSRLAGHFLDLLRGLTTLKVYGQADRQVDSVRRATQQYRRQTMSTLRVAFLSALVLDLVATLAVAVVAVDVGLRLDHGHLSLRSALLVLLLAPEVFAPLRAVGAQFHASEEGRVAVAAALDVVDDAADASGQSAGSGTMTPTEGDLFVRDLRVTYPDRPPALDGLDLRVRSGQIVAVTGRSGAGKSSLLAALLRFAPASGTVRVDDTDVLAADPDAWRTQVAWVPQRPTPSQDTVGDEVALGAPAATADEIADVLALCRAPHAATPLGENGTQVSAGQRRRIALARALLRVRAVQAAGGVPLVLLDEPSEDLDAGTEQVVASVIGSLAGTATVLVVSHSPRIVEVADRHVVLSDGVVVASRAQNPIRPAPVPMPEVVPARPPVARADPVLPLRLRDLRLVGAMLLGGAAGLAGLGLLTTSVWLICRAAQQPNVQALAVAVVGVRTFALARALLRYAERLVSHDVALRMLADVRARVFVRLAVLAPAGLAGFRRGDLLRRFVSDVDGAQDGLVRAVIPAAGALITGLGAVVVALLLAPWAGLVLAAGVLVACVGIPMLSRRLAGSGTALAAAAGRRDLRAAALVDGLAELTAYDAARRTADLVATDDDEVVTATDRAGRAAAIGTGLGGAVAALTLPATLWAGAAAVTAGALDPVLLGVLMACVLAGFDAIAPLPAAFAAWGRFRAGWQRVADVLSVQPPVTEPDVPQAAPAGAVGVRTRDAAIAPAPALPPVVRDASLTVLPGERVALIGPSGSGKSTLLAAVLRLIPVADGTVEIIGGATSVPIGALRAVDVPPLIAGSLQGDHVFDASLRDNLRVVRPAATDAELDEVAARAGFREVVEALPSGWSTPAGVDGSALSGGQRQRLLIARALLADPAVLVLDEPTAHLDPQTEQELLVDLLAGTTGRTVLMSTHRVIGDPRIDVVFLVDDGTVRRVARQDVEGGSFVGAPSR